MNNTDIGQNKENQPSTQPHILVVDDDERLRDLLSQFLTENGFFVTTAVDASAVRDVLDYLSYDLIVLDVMMPGEDGMTLTKSLREEGMTTPVLLLTALGETESRIKGLESGADDYLPKPFEPRELLLRVNAILRRVTEAPPKKETTVEQFKLGRWDVNLQRGELLDGDEHVSLTAVEQTLLKALASRMGEVVTRDELAEMCNMNANERTIDVQITRLRKKVEEEDSKTPRYIQTVRGKGYILWGEV